jgi:hypothetical protein
MVWFAVAHAVQLVDGTFAIRCPELPGCETRNALVEAARQEFGETLSRRVLQMIDAGEIPPLYRFEELEGCFAERCAKQLQTPDRAPGTFDTVMPVRAKLPARAVVRLTMLRTGARPAAPEPDPEGPTEVRKLDEAASGLGDPDEIPLRAQSDEQPRVLAEIEEMIDSFTLANQPVPDCEPPHESVVPADNSVVRARPDQPTHEREAALQGEDPSTAVRIEHAVLPAIATDRISARNPTSAPRLGVAWRAGVKAHSADATEDTLASSNTTTAR